MEDGYCKLFKNNQGLRGASIISPGKRELLISKNESSGNKGYGDEHRNVNFEEGKFPSLEIWEDKVHIGPVESRAFKSNPYFTKVYLNQ